MSTSVTQSNEEGGNRQRYRRGKARGERGDAEEAAMLIADAEEVGRMLHGLIGSFEPTSR